MLSSHVSWMRRAAAVVARRTVSRAPRSGFGGLAAVRQTRWSAPLSTVSGPRWAKDDTVPTDAAAAAEAEAAGIAEAAAAAVAQEEAGAGSARTPLWDLFDSMEFGAAPESADFATAWLESHDRRFGMFVDGEWRQPEGRTYETVINPATGKPLAQVMQANNDDVDAAVEAATRAQVKWAALSPHARARHMYALARHLQKHHRLLAVIESMDNGKTIRETRDADVPLTVRHFYSHAGWAQLMDTKLRDYEPLGVVGQIIPWNFPLLMLAWKVAPAIAMGNTLVIKPAPWTRLSAMLFAEICAEAGLPPGVVNIVTGDNDMATYFAGHDGFSKLAFTGSTPVGKMLRRQIAGTGKKISLELGGKSPIVVFESADLDSAVEGVVQGIWYNQGQVCCAGSRLLVQESVAEKFLEKLKRRLMTLRVGMPLEKNMDMGSLVDKKQQATVAAFVEAGRAEGAEIFQAHAPDVEGGAFYPPTLITGVHTTSRLVQEEIFGPVLVAQTFRTPAEATALANNTRFGLSAGVWSENIGQALETAVSVRAGVVWVNCHNMFDAAAGFGGYKESGHGREGGEEGLYMYCQPKWQAALAKTKVPQAWRDNEKSWGAADVASTTPTMPGKVSSSSSGGGAGDASSLPKLGLNGAVDRTPKMYIGGAQKRPDGAYSRRVLSPSGRVLDQVGDGNRKDVRDAVEAAHKALPGWGKRAAYNRAQICFYIAENLSARQDEFARRLVDMTGCSMEAGVEEVEASIDRLFTYAAWADKYGGSIQETPLYGLTAAIHEPTGVIGMVCPTERPLLGFVSLVAPAVVRGNTVVVIPSEDAPLAATDLYQVLDTSDLPGGVINILTGKADHMARTLAEHQDVDAVWYFGSAEGSYHVERLAAGNVKRTFVSYGHQRDWLDKTQGEGEEFLREAVEVKNIWVPMGEQDAAGDVLPRRHRKRVNQRWYLLPMPSEPPTTILP